jgi:hypothetical protein
MIRQCACLHKTSRVFVYLTQICCYNSTLKLAFKKTNVWFVYFKWVIFSIRNIEYKIWFSSKHFEPVPLTPNSQTEKHYLTRGQYATLHNEVGLWAHPLVEIAWKVLTNELSNWILFLFFVFVISAPCDLPSAGHVLAIELHVLTSEAQRVRIRHPRNRKVRIPHFSTLNTIK